VKFGPIIQFFRIGERMSRREDNIVNCAERIAKKIKQGPRKIDGQYSKAVMIELERMDNHHRDKADDR
jgi:hypothetical protein